MTRKEYMQRLADALSPLPEKTREAAMTFCEEMLDDRMEDGMDEETAVAAMESPAALAGRIALENGEPIDMGNLRLPDLDERLSFARMAGEALDQVDKALENAEKPAAPEIPEIPDIPETPEAPKAGSNGTLDIGGIVQSALESARQGLEWGQKALEEAIDHGISDSQAPSGGKAPDGYEQKVFTCSADRLTGIDLTCANMPIQVIPCPGNTATLTYYTSPDDVYEAGLRGGVLTLDHQGRGRSGIKFSILGLRFFLDQARPTVELHLPPQALVDLTLKTSNSSIRVGGFSALCQVSAQTSNSRIEMRELVCKAMELKSSNGRLVMENVAAKKALSAVTSNSRIAADRVKGGADVTLKTSNGTVEVRQVFAGGPLSAVTSNGSIRAEGISGAALTLKTSNGNIRGALPGRQADYAIDSGTSNGKNSLPRQQAGVKPLFVHTSNGTIDVSFEG